MVDGFSSTFPRFGDGPIRVTTDLAACKAAPLRRDDMSHFGGDDQGGAFPFGWDDLSFNTNPDYQGGDFQQLFKPFECECHKLGFEKKTDLNRHLAKEKRKFLCDVPGCPSTQPNGDAPVFGTLNDKKRHYRDVHGTDLYGHPLPKFPCPWTNCKRHTDGFPRQKNLENHLKSLHDGQRPDGEAGLQQVAPPNADPPSMAASFAASASSQAPLAVPAAPMTPTLTRDPTLDASNPTPPESQWAGASASWAPLPPLTAAEADDPVVNAYVESITSIRADDDTRSTQLATIQRELASMQATWNAMEREMTENRRTEQFLLNKLAQRKEAIRAGRTQNAQRRRAATANATAAVAGAATAPSTMQSE